MFFLKSFEIFFPLSAIARKKLFILERLHKKSNLGEKVTSTWKARFDFKRRRGEKKEGKTSLAFFFLWLQLNHHLASNWKKVKVKTKSLSRANERGWLKKSKELRCWRARKKWRRFFSCLRLSVALLGSLKHLQLIKIICKNSPGTFLTTRKQKQGRNTTWILINLRVTRDGRV